MHIHAGIVHISCLMLHNCRHKNNRGIRINPNPRIIAASFSRKKQVFRVKKLVGHPKLELLASNGMATFVMPFSITLNARHTHIKQTHTCIHRHTHTHHTDTNINTHTHTSHTHNMCCVCVCVGRISEHKTQQNSRCLIQPPG